MMDATERFSSRVEDYVKYRPSYPNELFDALEQNCGLAQRSVIAEVGSGTGIATRPLLERGHRVYGIEPNRAMREAAERALASFATDGRDDFISVEGRAETTELGERSVDLVLAAQAFHWFDAGACRREFSRILRPDGFVALVWNERIFDATPFLADYEALLSRYSIDYPSVRDSGAASVDALEAFFVPGGYRELGFQNSQDFDRDGLFGRARSSSYVPREGHPSYEKFFSGLAAIYEMYAVGGMVRFEYTTRLFWGRVVPPS